MTSSVQNDSTQKKVEKVHTVMLTSKGINSLLNKMKRNMKNVNIGILSV